MKKLAVILAFLLTLAVAAHSQEVFDLLRKGDIPAVKALIEKNPGILESRDQNGLTPLYYAAYGGNVAFIHYLIDKGAKTDPPDSHGTALHAAAVNDHAEAVAALIARGASLEARDDYSRTPLILCARERGQVATARVLLEAGADLNAADKFGDNALSLAAWRGKEQLVNLLLEKGATVPESGEKWEGLISMAASKGLTKLFGRLTAGGQDFTSVPAFKGTLLHSAAKGGAAEIVGALLAKGFDPAGRDIIGWTPLHYAALDGRTEAARKLVECGAPLNARNPVGQTAYNVALERQMEAIAGLLAEKGADKSDITFPVLKGDYLGQTPPGEKAELFAPGIISSIWGLHSTAVFSPDGNEVFWAPMMTFPGEIYARGGLLMMKRVDGRWTPPAWAPFSGVDLNDDVPFFSPDGKRIYFISVRSLPQGGGEGVERIWYADRTQTGWSEPRPFEAIGGQQIHWQFSIDRRGDLYFASRIPGGFGNDDIYCARFVDGKYEKPVNLGAAINSAETETTPFIAPDGRYLLFARGDNIWASFRDTEGAWSAPSDLGTELKGICPMITADGKFLFFNSFRTGRLHVHWISASVIDKVRANH